MFNFNSFTPNQTSQPIRAPLNKPLQNLSPAFIPVPQNNNWDNNPYFINAPQQELKIKEDNPFNARVLLEHEEEINSTSSDSEETDTMPDVSSTQFKTSSLVKDWDFGQESEERRKSDTFLSSSPGIVRTGSNPVIGNPKGWLPETGGKVIAKPNYFSPLNLGGYVQGEKKAYFVTIEGFNVASNKRFFKIERLCYSLQAKTSQNEAIDARQFLYIGLWNDSQMGQDDSDNIFEPWIYAIPFLQFKLVMTINASQTYEEPYRFEFLVDLRHFALPTMERRTQSLEVTYSESENNVTQVNNITLHIQVTNEKLLVPQGFRTLTQGKQEQPMDYTVILRQFMIGVPLSRLENPSSSVSPLIPQGKTHEPNGKRGSAQSLGQERRPSMLENCPQSPMSWSNFTPDNMSPSHKKNNQKLEDPVLPPGIMTSNASNAGNFETSNYAAGTSLFKFKGQQRFSMQPVRAQMEEIIAQRNNRNQSTDFSVFLRGDKSPLKIVEAYVNAVNSGTANRRESGLSGDSLGGIPAGRKLQHSGSGIMPGEGEVQCQSISTLNASSFGESMPEIAHVDDEPVMKPGDGVLEEFRIEDYIGRMVEYAKTFDGSKVLQKFVATADKEDLDLVVNELGEQIGELMLDPYANYMLQTLVQNCSAKQRLHLFQKMSPWFISIARDKKGTHSLQALVAQITSPEEISLIKSIVSNSVIDLSLDPRANYVIQKLINTIPIESSQFIYQPLLENFVQVANNSFGLLVLKQMMVRVEQKESQKQKVVEYACLHFEKLIQNPYGNYAIQHIVENYPKESFLIMNKILLKIIPYSSQKISSNVIEKCLTVCDFSFRRRVVEEILRNGRLGDLLKNKYGNFVTLQLLATSLPADKQKLMREIYKCASSFNGTKYKVRWLQFINENPLKINWNTGNKSPEDNVYRGGKLTEEELAIQKQGIDVESLEAVKRIWRDMTKEEKADAPTYQQYGKPTGKKQYNKRDDNYTGWVEKY